MRSVLLPALAGLALTAAPHDVTVTSQWSPSFGGKDLQVVLTLDGKDAETLWEVEDDELEEVRTDAGDVLKRSPFGVKLVQPGDPDPTRAGWKKLPDGQVLLVFEFDRPEQEVKSLPRFAGKYELLRGGEERWVDAPFAQPTELAAWEDESLSAAGFELSRGVREVAQLQFRLSGETFDVDEILLVVDGTEEELTQSSFADFEASRYHHDLEGDEPDSLVVRVVMEDETVIEVPDVKPGAEFGAVPSKPLAEVDLKLEARRTTVLEPYAEGAGDFDLLRGYRWVDRKGAPIDLFFDRQHGGGSRSVSAKCRIPEGLPRGAKLQLGVLVDAAWETVSFEYENIAGPR